MTAVNTSATNHLSYSRLRAYQNCSLAYFFKYVVKEPPEFTPAALAFGGAFHRAAEEALIQRMAGVQPGLDDLIKVFEASLDESEAGVPIRWGERDDRAAAIEQARRMLTAWLAADPPPGRVIAVEQSFEVEIAPWLPRLQGRVDLVIEDENTISLLDLKTSRTRWGADEIEAGADQLLLYRAGLRDLIEDTGKRVRLGWWIVGKVKQPWVELVYAPEPLPPMDRPIKIASIVLEAIEKGIFVPSPGWACASCPYRTACRVW